MDINDYLIDQTGKDWSLILRDWAPPLPTSFTLWLVNRFGDAFVVADDGSVHMLDVSVGALKRLADDRAQFATLLEHGNNANLWLMIPLVNACRASGIRPGPNQCYGFKIPPVLGGAYEVANVEPTDLHVHYSFLADIYRQTKDLPDGTQVKTVVVDC